MKIIIIGSKDFDSLEFHLSDSLKFLGHDVYQIDIKDVVKIPYRFNYWSQKLFPKYDKYIFDNVAKEVVDLRPDLVIGTYRFIHPDCITYIKKNLRNVKVIQVNPDALTTFEHQQVFASPYDAYFTKDPFIVDFMKDKMKLNVFYLPEAFNQRIHSYELKDRQNLENRINTDVVCFGTLYPYRAKMVEALIDSGLNVKLYGVPDRRFATDKISHHFQNEYITGERKAEVLIGSKIVFNNFHYAEVYSANAKYFEIAGMGAFQICDYKPTLDEYSGIPTEKYTYHNIDEAIEKINYYLDQPQERHTLAQQQREHFLKNHTYDIRLQQMLAMLGL